MNLDVTFPNAPCFMLDLDVMSSIQVYSEAAARQELVRRRLDKDGVLLNTPEPDINNPETAVKALADALQSGEQCNIRGKIHLQRVTGKIIVSFNSKLYFVEDLRRRYPEQGALLKLTHIIKSLTFGEVSQHIHILLRFGNTEHTNFDMMAMVDDEVYARDQQHMDYFYFMKLVPHIFVDEISQAEFKSYSYSLNHNAKQSMNDIGMISMIYDFTPVNMKITKKERDLPRFMVNLCAIIGGVFVIFGLINRFLL